MNKTRYMLAREEGLAEGLEKGKAVGREEARMQSIELLKLILLSRFAVIPTESLERLRQLSADQLKQIAVASVSAVTLAELGL